MIEIETFSKFKPLLMNVCFIYTSSFLSKKPVKEGHCLAIAHTKSIVRLKIHHLMVSAPIAANISTKEYSLYIVYV